MAPLRYHAGQLAVQAEANTTHVAEKLASWVGPVERYAAEADLVVLALTGGDGTLTHHALCGHPPLLVAIEPGVLELPAPLVARLLGPGDGPPGKAPTDAVRVGGLVVSLARAERARVNGTIQVREDGALFLAEERFTLCRKYLAPSIAVAGGLQIGPASVEPVAIDDPWVRQVVESAETSFLATRSPDGAPDVAHRGGSPGFLSIDAEAATLSWAEFVGDGVFKSAGNVRATGMATLLVPDLATGDAVELEGSAEYENTLTRFRPREDPLVQHRERYPTQGRLTVRLRSARRLRAFIHPRRRIEATLITSRDHPEEQAPR